MGSTQLYRGLEVSYRGFIEGFWKQTLSIIFWCLPLRGVGPRVDGLRFKISVDERFGFQGFGVQGLGVRVPVRTDCMRDSGSREKGLVQGFRGSGSCNDCVP